MQLTNVGLLQQSFFLKMLERKLLKQDRLATATTVIETSYQKHENP